MMDLPSGRVLILDDEPLIGRVLSLMADELMVESMSVSNPSAFFIAIDDWEPTHIILDLRMPEMDGVEVLKQLGLQKCNARIAISSGVGDRILAAAQVSAVEHGLDIAGLLPKPIQLESLQEFLCSAPDLTSHKRISNTSRERAEIVVASCDIEDAIRERQFRLVYQPKIDCVSHLVTGFEALIRWDHPNQGLIMPDQFIPLSERLGLIGLITDQVVELALNWCRTTPLQGSPSVSINMSAKTLEDREFPHWLGEMCDRTGIPKERLVLEITETAALDDELLALDMFTRLRMQGFSVSIDDYGIGASSLKLLARLPFSEVKVDKSFGMSSTKSRESRIIIKSTVELSHSLGLTVVTEGVEDRETLEFLREIGCDSAQGYYMSRPIPGEEVAIWMHQYHAGLTSPNKG